ncbi:MAG: Lin0512 family protein [Pseudomonadota bacterium]
MTDKTSNHKKPRVILEMGTGNDLHGGDYTKAALRAVQDALHHSSLGFIKSLGIDRSAIDVDVTIGVQAPERVDADAVKASLPVGNVSVTVVKGGLDVPDPDNNDPAVIASAAIAVRADIAGAS